MEEGISLEVKVQNIPEKLHADVQKNQAVRELFPAQLDSQVYFLGVPFGFSGL